MNHDDQERWLDELVAGEEISEFRRASLDRTLAAVRSRNRRRRAVRAGFLAAVPVVAAVILFLRMPGIERPKNPEAAPAQRAEAPAVRQITDEELLALFPGRSLALVGPPGQQRLMFLDGTAPPPSAKRL
jgi:hypothetical protein